MTMSDRDQSYFCDEPWVGIFSIRTNGDVVCCPCYAKLKIGNVRETTIHEIWNGDVMRDMRRHFSEGNLPAVCEGQLCPPIMKTLRGEPPDNA